MAVKYTLHITARDKELFLWVETSAASANDSELPEDLRQEGLEPYPYAAGHEFVRNRAGEALADAEAVWLPAWMPPVLEGESVEDTFALVEDDSELERFAIPAFRLEFRKHVPLIARLHDKGDVFQDVVLGEDVRFWTELLAFASALVENFRFRRDAIVDSGLIRPGWAADFGTRKVRSTMWSMLEEIPFLVHCFSFVEGERLVLLDPQGVVLRILHSFVDYLVREAEAVVYSREGARHFRGGGRSRGVWRLVLKKVPGFVPGGQRFALDTKMVANWEKIITSVSYTTVRPGIILSEPGSWSPKGYALAYKYVNRWRLVFYVGSGDRMSTRLPLPHAVKDRGAIGNTLRLSSSGPEEVLRKLFKPTGAYDAPGYTPGYPGEFFLSSEEAGHFLKYVVPELRELGFEMRLPAWFSEPEQIQELTLRAQVVEPAERRGSVPTLSLDRLLEFRWEVAVGGEPLSRKEIKKLLRQQAGLVRLARGWVLIRERDIEHLRSASEGKTKVQVRLRDVLKLTLTPELRFRDIPVQQIQFEEHLGELFQRLKEKRKFQLLPQPKGFVGTLRPYQVTGFSWLAFMSRWGLGACLADDMGLGKTIQTLALLQHDWERGQRRPVLLVCPTSVVQNWKKEAERFTPELPVLIHHGADRERTKAFVQQAQKHALVISSYSLLHRDLDILGKVKWAGIVLDEAQNIKNPKTKQARAARSLKADYRIALTGTPVENNVGELWSIMEFLNPGWLGSHRSFRFTFYTPIEKYGDEEAADLLRRLVGPFILRREKTDRSIISDLPEKLEMKVYCNLTKEQGALYETVLREVEKQLYESEGMKRRGLILATLTRLKQICNHPAQYLNDDSALDGRSGKLQRLVEMLDEILTVGDRALVFTQFAEMGSLLQRYLSEKFDTEVLYLHGGVPAKQRDKMVSAFQEKGGPPIFVLSLKAGGLGLNLTNANHVFHFDRWWNPAVENQATDRAFRIGQVKNVQVHKFICVGTLEESIDEMIERKKDVADRVVGGGEAWLTELSNEELKKLLALRPDALEE